MAISTVSFALKIAIALTPEINTPVNSCVAKFLL